MLEFLKVVFYKLSILSGVVTQMLTVVNLHRCENGKVPREGWLDFC